MLKWLREFFVGKDIVQPTTVEPPKPEVSQTITVEPPKLEVVPKTVEAKALKRKKTEPWTKFPTTPQEEVSKPARKPRAKKNANV